jgi:capsular polysaccharide export protein
LLLAIPPFPGAKCDGFVLSGHSPTDIADTVSCISLIRENRVGGCFWGARPNFPGRMQLLLVPKDEQQAAAMIAEVAVRYEPQSVAIVAINEAISAMAASDGFLHIKANSDPWHLFDHSAEIWVDAENGLALLAAIAGKKLECWGTGPFSNLAAASGKDDRQLAQILVETNFGHAAPLNPFTGEPSTLTDTVCLLAFWKDLIEANRDIDYAAGFGFWKRPSVAPLLWPGDRDVPFTDDLSAADKNSVAVIWTSRISASTENQIAEKRPKIIEVEDGFIRSNGLGANCVPPLSIIVDRRGIYFDPSRESDLEHILQNATITKELQAKAAELRKNIVAAAISKYGRIGRSSLASSAITKQSQGRKIVLVPGQVEDDRSVQSGGGNITTNLKLLECARACEPNAYIIYKPHPDVEAGHRLGEVEDDAALKFADIVVRDGDIIELVNAADHIHVLTSLTGFEALLRGKTVTTHGVPFYAGWGLTDDKGTIPGRRTKRRNLDELVAATLILYARYLDPVTNLPCPADILIQRLQEGLATPKSALIHFREFQGLIRLKIKKRIRWFGA